MPGMHLFLDDSPVVSQSPPRSLADALRLARALAADASRIIVGATLDAVAIPDQSLAEPDARPLPEDAEVRVSSADPRELVSQALAETTSSLTDLASLQSSAAVRIAEGKLTEAMRELQDAMAAWDSVQRAVFESLALLGISIESVRARAAPATAPRPLVEHVRSLSTCLHEVRRCVNHQDWSALADALEFDLGEQTEKWSVLLPDLARALSAPSDPRPGAAPVPAPISQPSSPHRIPE